MKARLWIGASFLISSAALIAACLEEDAPPASCASGGPDASCDGSIDPFGCLGPATLVGAWTAFAKEPNAEGTYTLTLKLLDPMLGDKGGTFVFRRDVTYNKSAPEHAGCHALNLSVGSYVAKEGFLSFGLGALKETREGCADPGDDIQDDSVPLGEDYKDALNGPYTLTACSLTINSVIYTNSKIPLDGGSGAGGAGGGTDSGPAECTEALKTSCFGDLACYTDIFKDCVPSGACTAGDQVIVNGQLVAPFCFDNGVKFQSKTETSDPFISFIDYYKSGGAFCWHADSTSTSGGDNTLVYKDMNGTELATVKTLSSGAQKVTCAGQPEVTLDAACSACSQSSGTIDCVKGACAVP